MDTHSVILTTRENSNFIRVKGLGVIVTIRENTDYIWVFFIPIVPLLQDGGP